MTYQTRHRPYAHQIEALRRLRDQPAFALLMAMRTGKTKVILDEFGQAEKNGELSDMLVIAPAGVYKVWLDEIKQHVGLDLAARLAVLCWSAGNKSQKAARAEAAFLASTMPRILLVDVEALSTVERARNLCVNFLGQRANMLIIDESTTIKDPDSRRSRFILNKLKPLSTRRRILSGLPAPNSPFDIWAQYYFLDPRILGTSFINHKNRYAEIERVCMLPRQFLADKLRRVSNLPNINGMSRQAILQQLAMRKVFVKSIPIIKRFRHEDELYRLTAPYSYRVRLEDCYDLPAKVYMKRNVTMTAPQQQLYNKLKRDFTAELASKDHVTATMVITRILRLHQILCGHVRDEEDKLHEVPTNRTKEVLAILNEYDGKAIIWCCYDYNIHQLTAALHQAYGEASVARFWGGNANTREEEEKLFKTDPQCRFMLSTQSAGGRGRDWSAARLMIYHSSTNNLEHRIQSEERGEAVGKVQPMTVMDLIVEGTVDEKIIAALRKKIDMAGAIVGDEWKAWLI